MVETVAFIRSAQQAWFERIRPYLFEANLNVGSGHGFFSDAARRAGISMMSLEVAVPEDSVEPDQVVVYDGVHMPFEDRAFDAAIALYVLHHTSDPAKVLGEMKRVSRKRVVLVEELYRHLPGKLGLALLDFWMNSSGGLRSRIRWNSYLTHARLLLLSEEGGWKVIHTQERARPGFDEVLWVIDRT